MSESVVTLASLGNGAVLELFDHELKKVIGNIADVNTSPTAKREINIKIIVKPDDDRDVGTTQIEVTSKLASTKPVKSTMYFGKKDGKLVAVESNPKQPSIFDGPNTGPRIVPLSTPASALAAAAAASSGIPAVIPSTMKGDTL